MPFLIEYRDGEVRRWSRTPDGVAVSTDADYVPSLYVAADPARLDALELRLARDPKVVGTGVERRYTSLLADAREPVLRVDVERVEEVRQVAREVRCLHERDAHPPGTFRLFDVDLSRQFRYCLDRRIDPTPDAPLSTLAVETTERAVQTGDLGAVRVGGEGEAGERRGARSDGRRSRERVGPARRGGSRAADRARLRDLAERVAAADPDVLLLSQADLVPLLCERAEAVGLDGFALGRRPGYEQFAGRSTYESYGRRVYSPPRYGVPGRVVVDRSSSFLHGKTGLAGLLELVRWSHKPVQEVGWASIGNVLTAIEIRRARKRGVLAPWNKWEPEAFKSVRTLHAGDRGGHVFEPTPGVYADVHEVDFASLYPTIFREYNVSPETVDCDCHDRADVPSVGYSVCEKPGFLPDVLGPLIDRREALKAGTAEVDAPDPAYEARSDALKWILVSCFGYQGYRNAKFGRIECHEAINAYAREILLTAKERFEAAGWRVVHGIIDSLWVTPADGDPEPLTRVCERVADAVRVPLDVECRYDWFALVGKRSEPGGALNRYVGSHAGGFKLRGIECRQRSTTAFVADAQRAMLRALDDDLRPGAAVEVLRERLATLRDGAVDPADLVVRRRVSKPLSGYDRDTRAVAALRRARALDHAVHPGSDVRFLVVDDGAARARERVRLGFEVGPATPYDADFYAERLRRATQSVVSPFGWRLQDVDAALTPGEDATLGRFA